MDFPWLLVPAFLIIDCVLILVLLALHAKARDERTEAKVEQAEARAERDRARDERRTLREHVMGAVETTKDSVDTLVRIGAAFAEDHERITALERRLAEYEQRGQNSEGTNGFR